MSKPLASTAESAFDSELGGAVYNAVVLGILVREKPVPPEKVIYVNTEKPQTKSAVFFWKSRDDEMTR